MTLMPSTRNAPPHAGAMLEALRGLGYSTAAALADIVDNSISAGATEVRIHFVWAGEASRMTVLDNGRGMDDADLERAMTLGDKNPLTARAENDLGRFGMGLKTASFSQCRRLTVASQTEGNARCCLRWDLDAIAADPSGGWLLFEGAAAGSADFLAPLAAQASGTLVLWECLDRVVTAEYTADHFCDLIDNIEKRLAMVFHRLLETPEEGEPALTLFLNDRPVKPWDPFLCGHPAKPWHSPSAKKMTPAGMVAVECHVLPHRDAFSEPEYEAAGGPEGWTAQQGFYVYRNGRLLVAGGWLGLGKGKAWHREESQRLARIRLDIPNTADMDWKIDIRKATARIPVALRPWLTKLAEDARTRARHVFAHRGSPQPRKKGEVLAQAWRTETTRTGVRYRIDENHPAIAGALESASGTLRPLLKAMLRVIEETVPVQRIWLDTAEHKDTPRTGFSGEPSAEVQAVLATLYNNLLQRGISAAAAKRTLAHTEPFQGFPALVAALPE